MDFKGNEPTISFRKLNLIFVNWMKNKILPSANDKDKCLTIIWLTDLLFSCFVFGRFIFGHFSDKVNLSLWPGLPLFRPLCWHHQRGVTWLNYSISWLISMQFFNEVTGAKSANLDSFFAHGEAHLLTTFLLLMCIHLDNKF